MQGIVLRPLSSVLSRHDGGLRYIRCRTHNGGNVKKASMHQNTRERLFRRRLKDYVTSRGGIETEEMKVTRSL